LKKASFLEKTMKIDILENISMFCLTDKLIEIKNDLITLFFYIFLQVERKKNIFSKFLFIK